MRVKDLCNKTKNLRNAALKTSNDVYNNLKYKFRSNSHTNQIKQLLINIKDKNKKPHLKFH